MHGDQANSKFKIQNIQGHFSKFSTTEREIQGHFHHDIWLKSNNIKEIPGLKSINNKKADILTQAPYKVLSYIFTDFAPKSYDFP